jgi:hypothetical protein
MIDEFLFFLPKTKFIDIQKKKETEMLNKINQQMNKKKRRQINNVL